MRAVSDHDHALTLSGQDPWVRWAVPREPCWRMWHTEEALIAERVGRRHSLTFIPLPGAADPEAALTHAVGTAARRGLIETLGVAAVSVPQPWVHVADGHLQLGPGGDWDWMWLTEEPAPSPLEDQIIELDDAADAAEIEQLSVTHSPTAEGAPGTGVSERWAGWRSGSGELIAAGAMQRLDTGIPHLAGIVVHPEHRGRGWGAAVTAALTRYALADSGVCTLGMYSSNAAARRAYTRLGYRTAWAWSSRAVHRVAAARAC